MSIVLLEASSTQPTTFPALTTAVTEYFTDSGLELVEDGIVGTPTDDFQLYKIELYMSMKLKYHHKSGKQNHYKNL